VVCGICMWLLVYACMLVELKGQGGPREFIGMLVGGIGAGGGVSTQSHLQHSACWIASTPI